MTALGKCLINGFLSNTILNVFVKRSTWSFSQMPHCPFSQIFHLAIWPFCLMPYFAVFAHPTSDLTSNAPFDGFCQMSHLLVFSKRPIRQTTYHIPRFKWFGGCLGISRGFCKGGRKAFDGRLRTVSDDIDDWLVF